MLWLEMDCSQLSGSGSCSLGSPNSSLSVPMIPSSTNKGPTGPAARCRPSRTKRLQDKPTGNQWLPSYSRVLVQCYYPYFRPRRKTSCSGRDPVGAPSTAGYQLGNEPGNFQKKKKKRPASCYGTPPTLPPGVGPHAKVLTRQELRSGIPSFSCNVLFCYVRPKLPESSFLLWATTNSPEPLLASNLHARTVQHGAVCTAVLRTVALNLRVGVTGFCLITNDRASVRNTYYKYCILFLGYVVSSCHDFQGNREQALWTMIRCLDTVAWLNAICGFRDGRLTAHT